MKSKQTKGKCQRRPPRASNHVIPFPTDVIFSNRKRPEVGISQEVLTVTHWLLVEGEKTIFLPKSWPSTTHLQGSFYGIPFDMGACSNIQSTASSWWHKILPHRMATARFPRGSNPHQTVEHQNSTGSTSSSPACPSTQPGWGCPSFLRWQNLLLPSNQANKENPSSSFCGFTGWQQNNPSLEKVNPEVGRKSLFNPF